MLKSLLIYVPALACVAMLVAMWMPTLSGRRRAGSSDEGATRQELAGLRREIARLKAERQLGGESCGA